MLKKYGPVFLAGFVFAILCFLVLNAAMKPASTPEFCGSTCHEMGQAYQSWELSTHGSNERGLRVECVDCHFPSKDKYFTHVLFRGYEGTKDMYKHYIVGVEYDFEKSYEKVLAHLPNERCLGCHDNLLGKPGSSAAREAHMEVLNPPDEEGYRCVECHEGVGHQRQSKLFTP